MRSIFHVLARVLVGAEFAGTGSLPISVRHSGSDWHHRLDRGVGECRDHHLDGVAGGRWRNGG